MFGKIISNVSVSSPLVHAITNYVTVNDCANIILASGGSPIMADDVNEVCDITSICSSVIINMGTLNKRTIKAMLLSGKRANELGKPVVFDPVGAGASELRNETARDILKDVKLAVIRGNVSEIKSLFAGDGNTKGVDASEADKIASDNIDNMISLAKAFSKKIGAVIAITGAIDIVADEKKAYIIKNGHPMMSRVSGTGCMLTSVIGSYVGANYDNMLDATAAAVCAMGVCGELAYNKLCKIDAGLGTYRTLLIDYMGKITGEALEEGAKIESR